MVIYAVICALKKSCSLENLALLQFDWSVTLECIPAADARCISGAEVEEMLGGIDCSCRSWHSGQPTLQIRFSVPATVFGSDRFAAADRDPKIGKLHHYFRIPTLVVSTAVTPSSPSGCA